MIRQIKDVAEIETQARAAWFATAHHGQPWISLTATVEDERNVVLTCDEEPGAYICRYQDRITYRLERLLPSGVNSRHSILQVIRCAFTRTPCLRLAYDGLTLSLADWMHQDSSLPITGRAIRLRLQPVELDVPFDEKLDRCIGAAALMIQSGQIAKGVAVYNGCASHRGLGLAKVSSTDPLKIELGGFALSIADFDTHVEDEANEEKSVEHSTVSKKPIVLREVP